MQLIDQNVELLETSIDSGQVNSLASLRELLKLPYDVGEALLE